MSKDSCFLEMFTLEALGLVLVCWYDSTSVCDFHSSWWFIVNVAQTGYS